MKEKKIFGYEYTNNEYIKIIMYLFVGGSAALFEWAMFYLFLQGLQSCHYSGSRRKPYWYRRR